MHVCMYACMHVCMYVCMYVSTQTYRHTDIHTHRHTDIHTYRKTHRHTDTHRHTGTNPLTHSLTHSAAYAIEQPSKACSSDSILVSHTECNAAKAVLDPGTSVLKVTTAAKIPKGCSKRKIGGRDQWHFNKHPTGLLDNSSKPVCKATAGEAHPLTHSLTDSLTQITQMTH